LVRTAEISFRSRNGSIDAQSGARRSPRGLEYGDYVEGHRVVPMRDRGIRADDSVDQGQGRPGAPSPVQPVAAVRTPVLGYATVHEEDGDCSHAELRRQAVEIASECAQRRLHLLGIVREREREHQRPLERPALGYALGKIAAGEAHGLVVADLSRMSRSVPELGRVLEWLAGRDARFVAAGTGLDTNEKAGRLAVRTIIEVSRWERQRLAERTRNGMRAARRKGPARVADQPQLTERIASMRAAGMTLQAIADQLNAEGVPTVRGGAKWRPSSVQAAAGYRRPAAGYMFDPEPRGAALRANGGNRG